MKTFRTTPIAHAAQALAAALTLLVAPAHAATYSWSSGNFVPGTTAPEPLAAGDELNIQSSSSKTFNGVTFTNNGSVNWLASSGGIGFATGAMVDNHGLWDAQGNASLVYSNGSAVTFSNDGTLRKSGGTGTTTIGNSSSFSFINSGTIEAQTGTLQFSGANTFNAGTVFSGAGGVVVNSASTFNGAFTSSNLTLASTASTLLTGGDALLHGSTAWSGGALTGSWTIAADGALTGTGGGATGNKAINAASVTNNGLLALDSSTGISMSNSATLTNSGTLDLRTDSGLSYSSGGAVTLTNSGLLRKSSGTGTSTVGNISSFGFINSGTIDAQTGTIQLSGANTFNAGTVFSGSGGVLVNSASAFNGAFTSSNLTLSASASTLMTGGDAVLHGSVDWIGGALAGTWTIAADGTLNGIGGGATGNKAINGGNVTNNGSLVLDSPTGISMSNGAALTNNGSFDIRSNVGVGYSSGAATTFTNTGTLTKSVGTGTSTIGNGGSFGFTNSGTIDAQSGTLQFGGANTFNAGTVFSGSGNVVVNSASTFNGGFTSANMALSAGASTAMTGNAAALHGSVDWGGGNLTGTWTVAADGTLNATGSSATGNKAINGGTLTNDGTLTLNSATGISMSNGSQVVNDGLVDLQVNQGLSYSNGSAVGFTNNGMLRKSGGSGTSTIGGSTASFSLVNHGVIDARTGTLRLTDHFVNDGTLTGDATLQVSGGLTNNGTLAAGSFGVGTLALTGGSLTQGAGALFAVDLTSLASHDLLNVTGSAFLDGTLALNCLGDCSFAVGDTFTILDATTTLAGTFAGVTLSGFETGAFDVLYDAPSASVLLRVTETVTAAVPEPDTYAMLLAGLGAVGFVARRRRRAR